MVKKEEREKKSMHSVLFWYNNDFAETKELAEKIAKEDLSITEKIPENLKKKIKTNGIFQHLLRTLVETYVKQKKEAYLIKHGKS
jgi:hypothetical protein